MAGSADLDHSAVFAIYLRLVQRWDLTKEERCMLLGVDQRVYGGWEIDRDNVRLSAEQVRRVSYLINIYDGIHRMFPGGHHADDWIRCHNEAFAGKTLLELLSTGDLADLQAVHENIQSVAANL